jgi:predicted nucleic acid-binding Zn finger protein
MKFIELVAVNNIRMFLCFGEGTKQYFLTISEEGYRCTCPSFLFRKKECKHIKALRELTKVNE